MSKIDTASLKSCLADLNAAYAYLQKQAFNAMGPPPGPAMGGAPPMDPNAMPPGGAPPAGGGAVSPELEGILTQLADGMGDIAATSEEQQGAIDQLSKQQLQLEKMLQELKESINGPLPTDAEAEDQAATAEGALPSAAQSPTEHSSGVLDQLAGA